MPITQEELDKMYFVYKEGYEDIEGVPVSDKEPSLGNPGTSGFVLSSTTAGVRSWVAQTGGMVYPAAGIPVSLGPGLGWSASITDASANWNTAYTDRLKWDGGATGLVAATGRTSLGLGTAAVENVGFFATAGHNHTGVYEVAGATAAHELAYNHASFLTSVPHASISDWGTILLDGVSSTKYFRGDGTWQTVSSVPGPHNLVDTTNHPVIGLTTGYFLKATSPTTYEFQHHGITPAGINAATSTHAHGNITSLGAIGSTTGLPVITTTSGVLTVGSFGTTAGTFAQGNDTRFVSITPTPAEHQITVWGGSATIKGMVGLTFDGTDLYVPGNIRATGEVAAYSGAAPINWWNSTPVRYSIELVAGPYIQLKNDADTPGINKMYGTDGAGAKGWFAVPASGVSAHASLTQLDYASAGHTGFAPTSHSHAWSDLTSGVPSTFTPSSHNNSAHSETYITSAALSPYAPIASPTFTGTVTMTDAFLAGYSNEVWTQSSVNAAAQLHVNFRGYASGYTQFRDLGIYNGKTAIVAFFDGVNGRVGIGTTTPGAKLEITGTNGTNTEIIRFGRGDVNRFNSIFSLAPAGGGGTGGSLDFRVHDGVGGDTQSTVMTMLGSGAVGIGTTTPGKDLQIGGAVAGTKTIRLHDSVHYWDYIHYAPNNYVYWSFDGVDKMWLSNAGNLSLLGSGATATPNYINLGETYSNGETNTKLKLIFHSGGYGISVGSNADMQYHSSTYNDFYINDVRKLRISSTGITVSGGIWTGGQITGAAGDYLSMYCRIGQGNNGNILFNNGTGANLILAETASSVYSFGYGNAGATPTSILSINMSSGLVTTAANLTVGGDITVTGNEIYLNGTNYLTGDTAGLIRTNGNFAASGEVTAYYSSDERLKYNIKPFRALDIIDKIHPKTFQWNDTAKQLNSSKDDRMNYGIIAQQLEEVLPELIHPIYENYKAINYVQLISILIQAVKELKEQINGSTRYN